MARVSARHGQLTHTTSHGAARIGELISGAGAAGKPLATPGIDSENGVVDYSTPEFLGVRTADGLYRFFGRNHFGSVVGMSAHLLVDGVDGPEREAARKGVAGRGVRLKNVSRSSIWRLVRACRWRSR